MAKNKGKKNSGGRPDPPDRSPGTVGKGLLGKTPKALKATGKKKLSKQAMKLMKAVYAPAYADLKQQEKATVEQDEKRAADLQYYNNWLAEQSAQLREHGEAAEAAVAQRQQQIQQDAADSINSMRQQVIDGVQSQIGTVSNGQTATAADMTAEGRRAMDTVANERLATAGQVGSNARSRDYIVGQNNAFVASSDAKRQSDTARTLKDLGDARTKVRLEQASLQIGEGLLLPVGTRIGGPTRGQHEVRQRAAHRGADLLLEPVEDRGDHDQHGDADHHAADGDHVDQAAAQVAKRKEEAVHEPSANGRRGRWERLLRWWRLPPVRPTPAGGASAGAPLLPRLAGRAA